MSYQDYITSTRWRTRRDRFLAVNGRACQVCGSDEVHVHHLSYARMGNEPDSDLMALCQEHHELAHQYVRLTGKSIRQGTLEMVRESTFRVRPARQQFRAQHKKPAPKFPSSPKRPKFLNSQKRRHPTDGKFAGEVAALDEWNRQRRAFVPLRQRMTQEERTAEPVSGPEGDLVGCQSEPLLAMDDASPARTHNTSRP